jgi:hypothetical protein
VRAGTLRRSPAPFASDDFEEIVRSEKL